MLHTPVEHHSKSGKWQFCKLCFIKGLFEYREAIFSIMSVHSVNGKQSIKMFNRILILNLLTSFSLVFMQFDCQCQS